MLGKMKAGESRNGKRSSFTTFAVRLGALIFWIAVWQAASMAVDSEVLLPSPHAVLRSLAALVRTEEFWLSALSSLKRIMLGYICAVVFGTVAALMICRSRVLSAIVTPLLDVITATPVASFIILALVWIGRESVPAFISFLIVFPVMISHVSSGIRSVDPALREMCRVYGFSSACKLVLLYLPSSLPQIASGMAVSLGLAWKSGIASEVLSIPKRSIGRHVYESKLYLETSELFAWTVTVIILSMFIEKLLGYILLGISSRRKKQKHFLFDVSPKPEVESCMMQSDITVSGLYKSFGEREILGGLTFTVPAHRITAISGPSGCGKTTVLRILCGLEKPDGGHAAGYSSKDCAPVFQEPRLLPRSSIIENVAYASPEFRLTDRKEALSQAHDVLSALGIDESAQLLFPSEISGGMCQRAAIARALVSRRPFLLLDEPFRGLDAELKKHIVSEVCKRSDTVLLITHDVREAEDMNARILYWDSLGRME